MGRQGKGQNDAGKNKESTCDGGQAMVSPPTLLVAFAEAVPELKGYRRFLVPLSRRELESVSLLSPGRVFMFGVSGAACTPPKQSEALVSRGKI
jgi:hypothetical protein